MLLKIIKILNTRAQKKTLAANSTGCLAFAISTGLHSNPQKTKRPEPRITMSSASAKQAPVKADASQLLLSCFLQD